MDGFYTSWVVDEDELMSDEEIEAWARTQELEKVYKAHRFNPKDSHPFVFLEPRYRRPIRLELDLDRLETDPAYETALRKNIMHDIENLRVHNTRQMLPGEWMLSL